MKEHLLKLQINDKTFIWQSPELASLLIALSNENKLLGLQFMDDDLKVINYHDLFDTNQFDSFNNNTTIILDRNLLISARNIYNNGYSSDEVDRFFLQTLAYAMFTNALLDSTISLYEGGDSKFISANKDLRKMRTVDNLPLDTVLQLLFGEIEKIPNKILKEAKLATKPIKDKFLKENYKKQLTLFKHNYPYFLKATIILRQKHLTFVEKYKLFINWVNENYISINIPYIIVFYCLYYNGGILKKIQGNNKEKVLKYIQNATWDATLLSYLKDQSKKNIGRYFLLATNDNRLVEVMKYCFSPHYEIEKLYGKNKKEIKTFIKHNNELCNHKDRDKLVAERLNNLDKIIENLEAEL